MMTNKELDIIGEAYQRTYDERAKLLNYEDSDDVNHQLDILKIADTWIIYPGIEELVRKIPDKEVFELLLALAKDIDLLDDVRILADTNREKEALLKLMRVQDDLYQKINFTAFAKALNKEVTINILVKSILEIRLRLFDLIIRQVNESIVVTTSLEDYTSFMYNSYNIDIIKESIFK